MSNWLDEWEQKARAATQGNWTVDRKGQSWCGIESSAAPYDWIAYSTEECELLLRNADHIAHSSPAFVLEVIAKLRAAEDVLADLFKMMDEGKLVRNTDEDDKVDWPISALSFMLRLKTAHETLKDLRRAPGGVEG